MKETFKIDLKKLIFYLFCNLEINVVARVSDCDQDFNSLCLELVDLLLNLFDLVQDPDRTGLSEIDGLGSQVPDDPDFTRSDLPDDRRLEERSKF
jgi:hypothetical protein